MLKINVHANTLLAMGVLTLNLDTLRSSARKDFSSQFSTFKHEGSHNAVKSLTAAKDFHK
jgi:hypothetical protein